VKIFTGVAVYFEGLHEVGVILFFVKKFFEFFGDFFDGLHFEFLQNEFLLYFYVDCFLVVLLKPVDDHGDANEDHLYQLDQIETVEGHLRTFRVDCRGDGAHLVAVVVVLVLHELVDVAWVEVLEEDRVQVVEEFVEVFAHLLAGLDVVHGHHFDDVLALVVGLEEQFHRAVVPDDEVAHARVKRVCEVGVVGLEFYVLAGVLGDLVGDQLALQHGVHALEAADVLVHPEQVLLGVEDAFDVGGLPHLRAGRELLDQVGCVECDEEHGHHALHEILQFEAHGFLFILELAPADQQRQDWVLDRKHEGFTFVPVDEEAGEHRHHQENHPDPGRKGEDQALEVEFVGQDAALDLPLESEDGQRLVAHLGPRLELVALPVHAEVDVVVAQLHDALRATVLAVLLSHALLQRLFTHRHLLELILRLNRRVCHDYSI